MDIIAAHQQGLIEQLEDEVAAIAGRARDHCQRAIALHHLFDHSRGAHEWALAEARRELRIARRLQLLARKLDRWGWLHPRREETADALARLADALGQESRQRCAAAYLAYRLSATTALRSEAILRLPPALLEALDQCHEARRSGGTVTGIACLSEQSELQAEAATDAESMTAAWSDIGATWLGRAAMRLLSSRALSRAAARDRKRGWKGTERSVRNDPLLPGSFRANPAQHYYALQQALTERRRREWREACDREPDSFALAA